MDIDQKLVFITGKGGSGKTLMSAIIGANQSAKGKKVLLVDSEDSGFLSQAFEDKGVGYEPIEALNNLYISRISTDEALSQYLQLYAKIPSWAKITPLSKLIDLVSHAAPGVKEILVAGKICYEVKRIIEGESDFDLVIVDAPSSGHIISLIDAPNALSEIVSKGMIDNQAKWMKDILEDQNTTGVLISTLSDEVVMSETLELREQIAKKTQVNIFGIILNKYIEESQAESSKIDDSEIVEFYKNILSQQDAAISQMQNVSVYTFPLLYDPLPSVRTLIKRANSLKFLGVKP